MALLAPLATSMSGALGFHEHSSGSKFLVNNTAPVLALFVFTH